MVLWRCGLCCGTGRVQGLQQQPVLSCECLGAHSQLRALLLPCSLQGVPQCMFVLRAFCACLAPCRCMWWRFHEPGLEA